MLSRAFAEQVTWGPIALALVPTLVLAWAVARGVRRLAARGLRKMLHGTLAESSPLVRGPLRLLGAAVFLLVTALVLVPAFELAGLHPRAGVHLSSLAGWALGDGLRMIVIALLAYASVRATALVVHRFEHDVAAGSTLDALERAKRARTLGAAVSKVSTVLIVSIAVLMILKLLQIDIAPVLTGAGIAGLAVGFGAQTLVRDVISGFFLLLEDQVRVGDVAAINGTGGLVEQLNLRTIVLRDAEGTVHVFPNGAITTLANRSKDFSYYVIDLNVSYHEDPDRIMALLREIGATLQADPACGPFVLGPLEIQGVDGFADWWMVIKMRIKTMPLKQWEVGRELRKRIKKTFDAQGIDMPAPALAPNVVHVHPSSQPAPNSPTTATATATASGPATPARS
jgi:moderate conductance mechanosensitive channel